MSNLKNYSDEELLMLYDSDIEEALKARGYEYGWHKAIKNAGEIYILINPAFPNLVKIGYADNMIKRVKTLNSNSGLPDPYHIYATYKVKKRLEDLRLHTLIDSLDADLRHSKNREFYEMTPEKAYSILSAIAQINGDEELLVLNPTGDNFFGEANDEWPLATADNRKRGRLTFEMLGIPVGSGLIDKDDVSLVVKTADNKSSVEYMGHIYTMSGLIRYLKNGGSWQGSEYLLYNGRKLTEIRREIEGD